uniref:Uncharacterized protein AlNc14C138G7172 n=1 Tax=Albugo laibachii Nc14 TaxID=890382 RepID=F0WKY2_9STRA|nr:conserved hypothetical protein [Albugo laibachii Nc14]|eukprot:CCA21941.1 conserved hypothetical protein [Albugo laibachii Nc14]
MTGTKGTRSQRVKILSVNAIAQRTTDPIDITLSSSNDTIPTQKSKQSIQPIGSIATDTTFQQHPYLNFIQKRKRSYKKKLDKVIALESACADGKVLNEQQQELVSGKPMLERLLLELDMIRDQFIESMEDKASMSLPDSERVLQEEAMESPKEAPDSAIPTDGELHATTELLKVLHIVDAYRNLDQEIPAVLDYCSQVLLGRTRPPAEVSFEENLAESVDVASKYAQKSDVVFACDTTYAQLNEIVSRLVTTKAPIHSLVEHKVNGVSSFVLEEAIVPQSESNGHAMSNGSVHVNQKSPVKPMAVKNVATINFFTDSTLSNEKRTTQQRYRKGGA